MSGAWYLFDNTPCAVKSLSKLSVLLCLEQGTEQHLLTEKILMLRRGKNDDVDDNSDDYHNFGDVS